RIDEDHYTVIGIMPPHYGLWGGELYVPFQLNPSDPNRSDRHLRVVALIRKDVSLDQVNSRLDQFARTLARDYAATNPEYEGMNVTTWNIKDAVVGGVRPLLLILMGVVGLIVVIASANIGNLLLAKASGRRREMAVRTALGAGRWRIARQLMTESVVLALVGGTIGALLACWGVPAAVALVGRTQLPYSEQIRLDARALLLALGVAIFMGALFGLAPALYSGRRDLVGAIRESGLQSGASREVRFARAALVVSQVALAMVVLAGAGLMIRSYRELMHLDIGYNAHNALTAQLSLPSDRYPTNEKIVSFYGELIERLQSSRGIDGAGVASGRPLLERITDVATQDFYLPGQEGDKNAPNANLRVVSPGFFSVAGLRLVRGRLFSDSDTLQTEAVAVINQTMAKLYWPRQDAVGQSIRLGAHYSSDPDSSAGRWVRIIGAVSDARQVRVIDVPVRQEIFFPLTQRPELMRGVMLIVRSKLATEALTS
ncbi:MAG TPA: ABC transporter permease, partial [Ktedonobacterales bacterium]|nr:ABC transporter permease [Ktedonobacterales bacterium]